jgi:hypothetical protein
MSDLIMIELNKIIDNNYFILFGKKVLSPEEPNFGHTIKKERQD